MYFLWSFGKNLYTFFDPSKYKDAFYFSLIFFKESCRDHSLEITRTEITKHHGVFNKRQKFLS